MGPKDYRVLCWSSQETLVGLSTIEFDDKNMPFLKALTRYGSGSTLFVTKDKCLGIGLHGIQKGDHLCYLSGDDVPYILRKHGASYKLIGQAYAHDWQDVS